MTNGARSVDYCRDVWRRLPELDFLERGAVAPAQFAGAYIREWELALDRPAFLDEFKRWVVGELDGVAALLERLRRRFRLACLSNVNVAHWERCVEPVRNHDDAATLSQAGFI